MQEDLERVLFNEQTILRRLDEMAAEISRDYRDRELTVIAVLNGSIIFMADLLRRIPLPLKLDCLGVASYHGGTKSTGEVIFKQIALPDIADRHVLILDDILDSGLSLAAIREKLETAKPRTVRICVLIAQTQSAQLAGACGLYRLRHRRRVRCRLRPRLHGALSQPAVHRRSAERPDRRSMKVRAQFFAQLRDVAGAPEETVELPDGATTADLLAKIYERMPALRRWDRNILLGAGVEFVDRKYALQPDETIAIMPPVQGG